MNLVEKYRDCFVEYIPIREGEYIVGIECVGDSSKCSRVLMEIEKRVDIQRAKRNGCRGAQEICDFLNGVR